METLSLALDTRVPQFWPENSDGATDTRRNTGTCCPLATVCVQPPDALQASDALRPVLENPEGSKFQGVTRSSLPLSPEVEAEGPKLPSHSLP